jgi:primary-amine oxidase
MEGTPMQRTDSPTVKTNRLALRATILILAFCPLMHGRAIAASRHPLDPLSKEEIATAVQVLKSSGKVNERSRFPIIVLHEPPKVEVLKFRTGTPPRREAFACVYERDGNKTFEAIIDLDNKSLLSWKEIPGAQPTMLVEDYMLIQSIVRSDSRWQEAIKKRGITDFQGVQLDPWSAGNFGFPEEQGIRIFRAVAYYKGKAKNGYARPIEGVIAYVDLNAKKVFKLVDTEVVPVAKATADFDEKSVEKPREAPKPLQITQPQGASFTVEGNEVRWQNWRFRYAIHPREGLVLYTVGYEDRGKLRPVLYRASLSEMVVPYGDPSETWFFRNAFDQGEYGLGRFANSLEPLLDAPQNAAFFSSVFANEAGGSYEAPRTVAIYERDGGVLWRHMEVETNRIESRRARQLVVSWIGTAGNYDYGFNWVFHQDGTLEIDVDLTGIMQPKGVKQTTASAHEHAEESYGHLVAENVEAVHHQHFFNFRLDMDVDGAANSVVETNTEAIPQGPQNPYANAFVMKETLFRREQEAQRPVSLAANRKWKVINHSIKNGLGQSTGYLLVPGENSVPYAAPASSVRKRAGFLNAHLWVTQYEPTETNAAGYYINQSKGGEGLPKWTAANRSIENQDVVLWYTFGVTHIPRPEEWPVMNVHRAGFKLMPSGFFARNPALDVPKGNGQ